MYSTAADTVLSHPLLYGGLAVLSWYVVSAFISWYRLRHIPGPWLASVSYAWIIKASRSGRIATIFEQLGQKYGPLVRIGPNDILTDDADFLRRMGAVRGTYNKSDWYISLRWQPYIDSTFTTSDRLLHDQRKAKIAVAYNISGREVDLIEPTIDEQVLVMIRLLHDKYVANAEGGGRAPLLEFSRLSSYFTMDVITRAAFGKEFGHVKADADVTGFLTHLRDAWPMVSMVAEWPFLRGLLFSRTYLSFFGPKPTDQTGAGKLMSAVVNVVRDRFERPDSSTKKDMLGSWMQHSLTQLDCEADGMVALIAGTETTASVMRITMLSLLSAPAAYRRLKDAVKQAISEQKVSEPITQEQCKEIPYLRAVVYEGLRMRPGSPAQFPKVVPPQGETIQGIFVPGGTFVGMNLPSVVRSQAVFGPDVDLFRPERFLEADKSQRADMERTVELMFGSGRWMCAGKPIAFMELYKTFFELFRNFDFQLANPTKPWYSRSYLVFVEEDMWLKVTKAEE